MYELDVLLTNSPEKLDVQAPSMYFRWTNVQRERSDGFHEIFTKGFVLDQNEDVHIV